MIAGDQIEAAPQGRSVSVGETWTLLGAPLRARQPQKAPAIALEMLPEISCTFLFSCRRIQETAYWCPPALQQRSAWLRPDSHCTKLPRHDSVQPWAGGSSRHVEAPSGPKQGRWLGPYQRLQATKHARAQQERLGAAVKQLCIEHKSHGDRTTKSFWHSAAESSTMPQ